MQLPFKYRFLKFRTGHHRLSVETGSLAQTPRNECICNLCSEETDHEYHILLECKSLKNIRIEYIPRYYSAHPNIYKFETLMSTNKYDLLIKLLCKFLTESGVPSPWVLHFMRCISEMCNY